MVSGPLLFPQSRNLLQFSMSYFFFFLKNIFCISYLTDGDFTGVINTLHSVVFVLLALEEEMV